MSIGFDIVGDVHGMVDVLIRLLEKMGYQRENANETFKHPEGRKVVFVGDLIDRGLHGFEVVDIAKSMTEAGHAITVMGNHELNAIFFHDERKLRTHSEKNIEQHQSFLYQVAMEKDGHKKRDEIIDWFKTLPLYYEHEGFRVVHACWDSESRERLDDILDDKNRLPEDQYINASTDNNGVYDIIEKWLKGDEQKLPNNVSFKDKNGHERDAARLQWWKDKNTALKDLALLQGDKKSIAENKVALSGHSLKTRVTYKEDKPVFVGHYWMKGKPKIQTPHVCCVDYSAGKGDKLCAYSWNGETQLSASNFIHESVREDEY